MNGVGSDKGTRESVGRRLRELRVAKGLTQRELASDTYTAAYVSTIEAGRRTPSSAAIDHFARNLGVDPEQILTGQPPDLAVRLRLNAQEARTTLSEGRYEEAERRFEAIAETAARYGLVRIEAKAEEGRGLVNERKGLPEKALERFERADRLLEAEPLPLKTEAIAGIARCTQMMGDVRYAIHLLETHLMQLMREELSDPIALMRTYSSLVWPYSEVGLYDRASAVATEALKLEARVEDPEQVANMHINVARELLRLGRADDALDSLKRAEHLFMALEWKAEVARAHLARGILFADQGNLTVAREELRGALEVFEATSGNLNRARALNELGRVERLAGRSDKAQELLQTSISLLQEADVAEQALAHRELGLCEVEDDPKLAEKNLRKAIDLYRRTEETSRMAYVYRQLGDLFISQGDVEAGKETYREGLLAVEAQDRA